MTKALRLVTIAVAALTLALVVWLRPPIASARDRAIENFVAAQGSACVASADFFLSEDAVARSIAEAGPHAGWIVDDLVFVGTLDEVVASLQGTIITSDESAVWVSAKRQAPTLLSLSKRSAGQNQGFVVPERFIVC